MILESMVALIGVLAVRVGKDVASNIENRIIGAALDVVDQKQQPQLSELNFGIHTLQKTQDEIKENQIIQIKGHYKSGIDFMRYAAGVTDSKEKKHNIHKAIESFTYASNIEVGEAAVHARVLVGACFFALRSIDGTTPIGLENGEYEQAFQLAEKTLVHTPSLLPYLRPQLSGFRPAPSRELIELLLKIPHLQQKYGTFQVYWKKWEPPKFVARPGIGPTVSGAPRIWSKSEPPKLVEPPKFRAAPPKAATVFRARRTCASCGKSFAVSEAVFGEQYCPECRSKNR